MTCAGASSSYRSSYGTGVQARWVPVADNPAGDTSTSHDSLRGGSPASSPVPVQ